MLKKRKDQPVVGEANLSQYKFEDCSHGCLGVDYGGQIYISLRISCKHFFKFEV